MKVLIDSTVYTLHNIAQKLDYIVSLFDDGRHEWVIENPADVGIIQQSYWATTARQSLKNSISNLVKASFVQGAYAVKSQDLKIVSQHQTSPQYNELLVDDALQYLQEPVWIILENQFNDGYFLDALIVHLGSTQLQQAKNKDWMRYRQVGGTGDIPKFVADESARYNAKPRFIVIVDSDKNTPTASLGRPQQNIINECINKNAAYHILYKREMENYLPDATLQRHANTFYRPESTYAVYLLLNSDQKDFYDFEKGFKQKPSKKGFWYCLFSIFQKKTLLQRLYPQNQQSLFGTLSDADYEALKSGFKKSKTTFPPLFLGASRADLLTRCAHQPDPNELQKIVDKIDSLL